MRAISSQPSADSTLLSSNPRTKPNVVFNNSIDIVLESSSLRHAIIIRDQWLRQRLALAAQQQKEIVESSL
jgi:hypothetical protein